MSANVNHGRSRCQAGVAERALGDDLPEELRVLLVERAVDLDRGAEVNVGARATEARLVVLRGDDEEDDECDDRDGEEHHDHPGGASQEEQGHGEPSARYAGRRQAVLLPEVVPAG